MERFIAVAIVGTLFVGSAQGGQLVVAGGLDTSNANLQLWLRADMGVTISGGGVTGWTDQSANGYVFDLLDAGRAPDYIASDRDANYQATIDFVRDPSATPVGTCLKCDEAGVIPATGTVINVVRMVPVGGKIWSTANSDATIRRELFLDTRTTSNRRPLVAYARDDRRSWWTRVGDVPADPNVLTDRFRMTLLTTDVAGAATTLTLTTGPTWGDTMRTTINAAPDVSGVAPLILGGYVDGGSAYDGEIAEMIVYDRVLTDEEMREVCRYLELRYFIPEPATALILLPGFAAVAWRRRRA